MAKRKTSTDLVPSNSKRAKPEDDEEDDIQNLSQGPGFMYNPTMGKDPECGIIEQVSVKNFMCHARLDFKFCPQVNFVIGRNGSGKSAVLNAIVVGLGGKATSTGRGSNIRGFIKTGKATAEVVIKLNNQGQDAYKPAEYGKSITVERKFSADGSCYKIKNADGKLVSNKREELNHILDQFNIQVENPLAILNQETSKNFLHSKSPADKYKFFLKATQLEQMKHEYARANEQKEITTEIIRQKEETLPQLEKEVLEWEQKYKALSSLDELRKKIDRLKREMAWAFVCEKEKEYDVLARALRTEDARTPKFVQKVEESQKKVEACIKQHKDEQEQLRLLGEEVQQLQPQHDSSKKTLVEKKRGHRNVQVEHSKLQHEMKNAAKDKIQLQERIEELKSSVQHDYESKKKEREEKLAQLSEQLETYAAQQRTTEHQIDQFRNAVNKYKEESYKLKAEEKDVKSHLEQTRHHIRTLESARSDRLKRFGHWTPALLEKIEQAWQQKRFHQKPRGPLGANMQLKDSKWALAVEACLKSLIHAFCCHDHHDEKVLEGLLREVCPQGEKPSIIVSAFTNQFYDVSRLRVRSDNYFSVIDMIEVEDPVIGNCLVDQRSIENILLIEVSEEARRVMSTRPPQNCREAFTIEGDQIYCLPTYRYYSSSTEKSKFLKTNVEEDIRNCQDELQKLEAEHEVMKKKLLDLNNDSKKNQQEERKSETQLMKIREAVRKITFEINELKSAAEPAPVDVRALEEEVLGYNQQIAELTDQISSLAVKVTQAKDEQEKADTTFREIDQRIRTLAEKADPLKERLAQIENEIENMKEHKKHYDQKLKEHNKKIDECRRKSDQHKKELEEDIHKAEQICERVSTRRTAQNLDSEIQQINKRIKAEEKNRGNKEEVTRNYHEKLEAYKNIKSEVSQFAAFLKKLSDVMTHRQQQYFAFRRMIAMRTKCFFIVLLSQRGYTGKLTFNHSKELLTLDVHPTSGDKEMCRDMRSLSGGERSFSTVCYILALWDAMESPFRCLDEFDVYMDMVNRRMSMDMMMKVAENQQSRQFIFLTPNDMSQIAITGKSRVYRMPDPDRGAGVLPYEPDQQ